MYDIFLTVGETPAKVAYTKNLDGGGTWFGQELPSIIKDRYPDRVFEKCHEWCCGPVFSGYAIMANNLTKSLCFNDKFPPALDAIEESAKLNGWEDRVTYYLLEDIALLPDHEQFDLIVGNPPHFGSFEQLEVPDPENRDRLCTDLDWNSHRNFFTHIKNHLTPDGVILLNEHMDWSSADDFKEMIDDSGLELTDVFRSERFDYIYYLEVRHKK